MAHKTNKQPAADVAQTRLVGLLAQFDDPDALVEAGARAHEAGYKKLDAFTPFPVPAIEQAIGIRRTVLPFIVLAIGMTCCGLGLFMQFYANKVDWSPVFPGYPFLISGKPLFSLPANVPVAYEITVLSSAFAAFFGMWILNGLPRLANPLHRVSRFRRVTNDRFFLLVGAGEEKYSSGRTRQQLEEWGATAIEEVHESLTDRQFPEIIKLAGLILVFLLMVPPALIFRNMGTVSRGGRLHVVPDMDWQDKYKPQDAAPDFAGSDDRTGLFADGRAMRKPLPGTIAIGMLENDLEQHRGFQPSPSAIVAAAPAAAPAGGGGTGQFSLQDHAPATGQDPAHQDPAPQDPAAAAAAAAAAEPEWATEFPEGMEINAAMVERGRKRFEIYCSVCHGYAGSGDGLVNQRAMALAANGQAAWTTAKSLHDPTVTVQPVGRIFDTITNGRNTMGPYKSQIPVADRWAIVLYVKALQETGIPAPVVAAPAGETPPATPPPAVSN